MTLTPNCVLSSEGKEMDRTHLQRCPVFFNAQDPERYWEARANIYERLGKLIIPIYHLLEQVNKLV